MIFTYERIQGLNDLEFEVYNQILIAKEKILLMTIRDLADVSHVSTTVVLNFCKKMDCSGWVEFKLKYKDEMQTVPEITTSFSPVLDYLQMYNSDEVKQEHIENVVQQIRIKKRLIFIGAGPSGIIAKYGSLFFSNHGISSQFIDTPYYFIPDDDYSETMVIAISSSGETESVLKRLARFKALNAMILAITNTKDNSISRIADLSLNYFVESDVHHVNEEMAEVQITNTSQVPVVYLLELIARKI